MSSVDGQFDRRMLFDHPDPYPLFAMLRQTQPVLATTHEGRPTFMLTKYDDCLAALQDAETYSSRSNAEAGQVTTFRLTGNLLFALLTERDRYERVRADRSLVPGAIEETLRWETSIVMLSRETTRPTEVRGTALPAGALVSVAIGSANRDEERYPRPDEYDLDRGATDHLAFGVGRHHCLGHHLARAEVTVALNAILDRFPRLRIDPDAPPPTITGMAFRSPKALPVLVS